MALRLAQSLWFIVGAFLIFCLVKFVFVRQKRLHWFSFGLLFGFSWFSLSYATVYLPSQALAGETIVLEAVVTQYPTLTDFGVTVPVRGGVSGGRSFAVNLQMDAAFETLKPGDQIRTIAHCRSTRLVAGRESFALRAKGIYLTGKSYGEATVTTPETTPLRYAPALWGGWLRDQICLLYDGDGEALLLALLTGWQDNLSDTMRNDFSRSGLSHVVSVSGMHISFLAGMLSILFRRATKKSALLQIGLIFFFAAMTGNGAGALRAAFLVSASLSAPLFGRRSDPLTSLFGGLLLLLLINPSAIAGAGLQFSFAATFGIYVLGQPLYHAWRKGLPKGRILSSLLSLIAISLGAMVFTLPLTAFYFGHISFISPVANLLTNGLIMLAFLGGMLSIFCFSIAPILGLFVASFVDIPIRLFLFLAQCFGRLPFAALPTSLLYYALFCVFLYTVLILWLYETSIRPIIPLCCLGIGFCLCLMLSNLSLTTKPLTFTALDVGQGQSLVLTSGRYRALVDCGGTKKPGYVASNYLQSYGWSRLDLLVLTHYHEDHSNGLEELFSRIRVDRMALPDSEAGSPERLAVEALAKAHGVTLWYINDETTIPFGTASIRLFPPIAELGDNEVGLSLLLSSGSWHALVTGDMSDATEQTLLSTYDLPILTLLVLGHHGSRYATSPALLSQTMPKYAFASVGQNNSYGHPAEETLARLAEANIPLYPTDALGSITIFAPKPED